MFRFDVRRPCPIKDQNDVFPFSLRCARENEISGEENKKLSSLSAKKSNCPTTVTKVSKFRQSRTEKTCKEGLSRSHATVPRIHSHYVYDSEATPLSATHGRSTAVHTVV